MLRQMRAGGGGGGGYSSVVGLAQGDLLVIAGGGAGAGGGSPSESLGGAGGGLSGQANLNGSSPGATQMSGFAPLSGGDAIIDGDDDTGGGGGGGWFGGPGGSGADSDAPGGGGGSGYVAQEAREFDLDTGDRNVPGQPQNPTRGTAGDPISGGKVVLVCNPSTP